MLDNFKNYPKFSLSFQCPKCLTTSANVRVAELESYVLIYTCCRCGHELKTQSADAPKENEC